MEEVAFRQILANQVSRYPRLQVQDLYKLIHQAALGSEHAIQSASAARRWLERELRELADGPAEPAIDLISADGRIVRVNLRPYIAEGGDANTLLAAFIRTANEYHSMPDGLRRYWAYAERMAEAGELPFAQAEMKCFFAEREAEGFPAVHHSAIYEPLYHPAYRVIAFSFLDTDLHGCDGVF